MLITVYQRMATGWQATRSFYRFPREGRPQIQPAEDLPAGQRARKPRYQCPGCESEFTEMAMDNHVCFGGAPGYPRIRTTGRAGRPMNNVIRDAQQRQPD
jgi:hypothetical protein